MDFIEIDEELYLITVTKAGVMGLKRVYERTRCEDHVPYVFWYVIILVEKSVDITKYVEEWLIRKTFYPREEIVPTTIEFLYELRDSQRKE